MALKKTDNKTLLDIMDKLEEYLSNVQELHATYNDKLESMSEKAREGDKGQELESLTSKLDNALAHLEQAKDEIGNVVTFE
jgi:hypothetical protein